MRASVRERVWASRPFPVVLGGTLPADWQQHLLLNCCGLALLNFRRRLALADAALQRVHQIHDVPAFWSRL
jgi:hypothetical protein